MKQYRPHLTRTNENTGLKEVQVYCFKSLSPFELHRNSGMHIRHIPCYKWSHTTLTRHLLVCSFSRPNKNRASAFSDHFIMICLFFLRCLHLIIISTNLINPMQNWLPLIYSFVPIKKSLTNVVWENKFFTIFVSKTRLVRLV